MNGVKFELFCMIAWETNFIVESFNDILVLFSSVYKSWQTTTDTIIVTAWGREPITAVFIHLKCHLPIPQMDTSISEHVTTPGAKVSKSERDIACGQLSHEEMESTSIELSQHWSLPIRWVLYYNTERYRVELDVFAYDEYMSYMASEVDSMYSSRTQVILLMRIHSNFMMHFKQIWQKRWMKTWTF